jgi:hypothetical protein
MLFLAVSLGFIVENFREHTIEHKRGMAYLKSWYHDLRTDTTNLGPVIADFWKKDRAIDSLMVHFDDIREPALSQVWGEYGTELDFYPDFVFAEGTIQQLKNSGGLRLIDDKEALDSIVSYDLFTRNVGFKSENVHQAQLVVEANNNSVFDLQKIYAEFYKGDSTAVYEKNEFILTTDRAVLGKFYNEIFRFKFICKKYLRALENAKLKTTGLIQFLEKRFHFE